jgi:hypothetical protein
VVWKDSEGTVMPILAPFQNLQDTSFFFFDSQGLVWLGQWRGVDAGWGDSVAPGVSTVAPAAQAGQLVYSGPDCTGTVYVKGPPPPGITFTLNESLINQTSATVFHVVPAGVDPVLADISSMKQVGCAIAQCAAPYPSCSCVAEQCSKPLPAGTKAAVVLLAATLPSPPLSKPALPGVGTLRPSLVP